MKKIIVCVLFFLVPLVVLAQVFYPQDVFIQNNLIYSQTSRTPISGLLFDGNGHSYEMLYGVRHGIERTYDANGQVIVQRLFQGGHLAGTSPQPVREERVAVQSAPTFEPVRYNPPHRRVTYAGYSGGEDYPYTSETTKNLIVGTIAGVGYVASLFFRPFFGATGALIQGDATQMFNLMVR